MKRVIAFITIVIIAYSVYFDLTVGTLTLDQPVTASSQTNENQVDITPSLPYQLKETDSGDTVISVVEHIHGGPLPVSIEQVIKDFGKLNNGVQPENIQLKQQYKFPVYQTSNE